VFVLISQAWDYLFGPAPTEVATATMTHSGKLNAAPKYTVKANRISMAENIMNSLREESQVLAMKRTREREDRARHAEARAKRDAGCDIEQTSSAEVSSLDLLAALASVTPKASTSAPSEIRDGTSLSQNNSTLSNLEIGKRITILELCNYHLKTFPIISYNTML
jgi:outer membrane protein assembly factor BamE (lipoprotein component of BamABCDE complex)